MKKSLFLLALLCFICTAHAKIFRIGYPGGSVSGVDYPETQIGAAHNAASPGDTLQLYQPYWNSYVTLTLTKKLVLIGYGYATSWNPGLQSVSNPRNSVGLTFNAGSEGSTIQGVHANPLNINANDITLSRSNCINTTITGAPRNNLVITACVLDRDLSNNSNTVLREASGSYATNAIICNNFIRGGGVNLLNSSGLFANNVLTNTCCNSQFGTFMVRNNIFTGQGPSITNGSLFSYNLFHPGVSNPSGTGNIFSGDPNAVFVNYNNGMDNGLILKTGSPAIGSGFGGTDMGIFGGEPAYVYKLSGIPAIPSIYQLTAPSQNASTNPYTITISVRSNN